MAEVILIAMRLADMVFRHPEQDNSRVCSGCGQVVGIFPSGQRVLAANPAAKVVCQVCHDPSAVDLHVTAPGALEERAALHARVAELE